MSLKLLLLVLTGLFWSIAYFDIIRVGLKQKTYGMPFLALSLNLTWELYNTVQGFLMVGFHIANTINLIWVVMDLMILYTYFKYGNSHLKIKPLLFYLGSIFIILVSFLLQYWIGEEKGLVLGAVYSAFWSNLLMSLLFIPLYYKRKNLLGQTLLIAYTKCLGTLAITILVGIIGINSLGGKISSITYIGGLTFIVDVWYIYLVHKRVKV